MKKIFYTILVAASVVACGKVDNTMYFDASDNRVYDDAAAEFDTLSYAVGMNLGLGLRYQSSGMTFNYDVLVAALSEELNKDMLDYELIEENKALIQRFSNERLRPYALANMSRERRNDPKLLPLPISLYDEEFTEDRVSEMFGRDMASYICIAAYPLNMHWLRTAINDAKTAEGNEIHDSLMRLTVMQMRGCLQNYHTKIHPEYIVETSRKWLEDIAKQPNVNKMVIDEFDTLYFRVNNAGNGVKPRSLNDTISFSYDLYTRSGKLVESHSKRADMIREALEKEQADTMPNSKKLVRIKQLTDQLNSVENLRIPISKSLIKGLQYGVQNVGEGGDITVWMPASLAFGERGNRVVHGHDAVVMNITLKSVSYGPTDEELAAMKEEKKSKGKTLPEGIVLPKQKSEGDAKSKPSSDNKLVIKPVELK